MPRYRITIEYDGTPFAGWQSQPGGATVQDHLIAAIHGFCGETVSVRPRIAELVTDRGTELLTLDTAVVVDGMLVARIEHAVIYSMTRRPQ